MSTAKRVRDLMIGDVKTVREDQSVWEAVQIMSQHKIGAVIVLSKEKRTAGIFTERDVLMRVVAKSKDLNIPVSEVMTRDLVCAQLHDEMDSIPELMAKGGFRHVPVLDGFEPVGILSIRDVLKYTLSQA